MNKSSEIEQLYYKAITNVDIYFNIIYMKISFLDKRIGWNVSSPVVAENLKYICY